MPEKVEHGDIDFLMILKKEFSPKDVMARLKSQKFVINNNNTINSVYKNKQVDFSFKPSD